MTEPELQTVPVEPVRSYTPLIKHVLLAGCCIGLLLIMYIWYLGTAATTDITQVEITSGQSVRDIAESVKEAGVVRSSTLLYAVLTYWHDPTKIFAGTYVFSGGENIFTVAEKLASNDIENDLTTLTLPEGIRLTQMAALAAAVLPEFDVEEYLVNTEGLEGYIFPETYYVPETFTAQNLIDLQRQTYEEKVAPLRDTIFLETLSEAEVIILASILEREANDAKSMRMVAGILQNRLAIDMPLQADATIEYVLDTPLSELPPEQLAAELRGTDSPYNTYKYIGLPPTPIGNPGLTAIEAVLNPIESEYFYYLTDGGGEFHYAATLAEHNQNIAEYLR